MEDRYLFKAKRIDNGEWIVGNRIDDGVTGQVFIHAAGNTVNESDKVGEDGCLRFVAFEVDPSTICQCTTFKDRNGNLVWENDLLKKFTGEGNDWEIAKVILGEYCLSLGWCQAGVKSLNQYNTDLFKCALNRYDASKCEIVGNIFDNPELLESEEK